MFLQINDASTTLSVQCKFSCLGIGFWSVCRHQRLMGLENSDETIVDRVESRHHHQDSSSKKDWVPTSGSVPDDVVSNSGIFIILLSCQL
jgi:hypothetical protein